MRMHMHMHMHMHIHMHMHTGDGDMFAHTSDILDGTQLEEGSLVRFIRYFDPAKQRYRATEITGGVGELGAEGTAGRGAKRDRAD